MASKVMRSAGLEVEVFEASTEVGGIWRRSGQVVYAGLRCNLPHQIMQFRHFPFAGVSRSFVTRGEVTEYLERYAEQCGAVRFATRVIEVKREKDDGWRVTTKSAEGTETHRFDFVVVANGHYEKPAEIVLDGQAFFPGQVTHSRDYWKPDAYAGQTVICVGARSSGTDIAKELAFDGAARRVIVVDKAAAVSTQYYGGRLVHAPPIRRLLPEGAVEFADDSLEPKVDSIILCHGFDYDFPFLSHDLVQAQGRSVWPLYLHMFHAEHPSLVFLGIPHSVVPFPLMQIQSILATRVFTGNAALPDVHARREAVQSHRHSLEREKDAHHLGDKQWMYSLHLLDLANLDDLSERDRWRQFVATNKAIYDHAGPRRPAIPGSPDIYRRLEYHVDHDAGDWKCLNEQAVDDDIRHELYAAQTTPSTCT